MTKQSLVDQIGTDRQLNILDHRWSIRSYLSKLHHNRIGNNNHLKLLYQVAISPFKYLNKYQSQIQQDQSLKAICQLCTNSDLILNIDHNDHQLSYLSQLFNELFDSDRGLLMCYDCGTVARGVFFSLIQAYRGSFHVTPKEIDRIRGEYYMNRYQPLEAWQILKDNLQKIKHNSMYLCAFDFGGKFGHIYVIEKIYIGSKPRYRIYQSCHQSYLLIDLIELMNYAQSQEHGIDLDDHLDGLKQIITAQPWELKEIQLFCRLFHFYPSDLISGSDEVKFVSTYIIY